MAKRLLFVLLLLIGAIAVYVQYVLVHNLHVVFGGPVYRSAQMSSGTLAHVIQAHGIRTILNQRGADPRPSGIPLKPTRRPKWAFITWISRFHPGAK